MKHNQYGFSALSVVILVLVIAVVGVAGWRVYETRSGVDDAGTVAEATLTGTVTEGPIAPICRDGESCTRAVSNHTIKALDASGNVAATGTTDGHGRYTLRLKPGRYTLTLAPQVGLGQAASSQIDIKPGTTTHDIVVDTGIR